MRSFADELTCRRVSGGHAVAIKPQAQRVFLDAQIDHALETDVVRYEVAREEVSRAEPLPARKSMKTHARRW
jgi:hypothetical protein